MARSLQDVMEALLSGVVVVDQTGAIEDLNSVACRILEHSREAALGLPVEGLVTPDHAVARLARKVLGDGVPVSETSQTVERRNDDDIVVDVAVSPLFSESRHLDGAVIMLRDRFSTRHLEQLESERERYLTFGRIAAGLAHEIRNPLGGIRGAGELLSRRAEEDKTRETADLIVRESTRIAKLVDEFMVFARGDELKLLPVNIHRVIDGVLELVAHDPLCDGIEIERAYDPSLPELLADPDRLHQVCLNLVRNALQAMEESGGHLTVKTRMTLEHRIALQGGGRLPTLAVWVEDTGCGMDASELREAHLPFFTTRAGGTGLGLAVADYWVAQHRGSLDLESEKGTGTRARITLPFRSTEETRDAEPADLEGRHR